jgi:DNA-binding MarR family transcriptional regulator
MSELADYLGLDKSTITGLVDRAERRGLLRRTPNPVDGRAVDVMLTAAGMELAERGATQIARSLSPMTSTLTRADAHRLTALLERMLVRSADQSR